MRAGRLFWAMGLGPMLLGSGCRLAGFYLDNPPNPIRGVLRIAVTPVEAPGTTDPLKLGEMLASELVQFPGVRVVRPAEVMAAARKNDLVLTDERSVRALGRLAGADAVLVAELTEYKAYFPPRIGVAAQLFFTAPSAPLARSAVDLSAEGRARPVAALDRGDLIQVEKIYDGSHRETRDLAGRYERGNDLGNEAIDGADRVLWLPELYFRFVSNRLVRDIFADYQAREQAAKRDGVSREAL
jgi:hypothetical protein